MQVNQLAGMISPLTKSDNKQSRTTEYANSNNRSARFRTARQNQQAPAPQLIHALVRQVLKAIQSPPATPLVSKDQEQENPHLKVDGSYFYMSDNAGYTYLVDRGSMKIVQAQRTVASGPKK